METSETIMALAVLIGPIAAVQIQKWLEKRRENRSRKIDVFKTLMTTRATRVSIDHVEALNMIDLEFTGKDYKKVIAAWRNYHDHLTNGNPQSETWGQKNEDLFIELLYEMGEALNYSFEKVMLKRTAYSPIAHGDLEFEQQAIRKGLATILSGKAAFPVFFTNQTDSEEQEKKKK